MLYRICFLYYFLPWSSYESWIDQRRMENISRSCGKPKYISKNDHHNCSTDDEHLSNVSLNPYILSDMDAADVMPLKHTTYEYSMTNEYPQTTTHQPRTDSIPVFSSLHRIDSKRKGLRQFFAFLQKNHSPNGQVNETVVRLTSWVIFGSPEQWIEFHRLWWIVNVFMCNNMF